MFRDDGELLLLSAANTRALPHVWRERHKVAEQLFDTGNPSLFMACMLSLLIWFLIVPPR